MAQVLEDEGRDSPGTVVQCFCNVSLPETKAGTTWDVQIKDGKVDQILESKGDHDTSAGKGGIINGHGALLAPSLCHPHIHIDKAYLLAHPKYSHLQIEKGDFKEAMSLTGRAKSEFEPEDLLERGQRVIDESILAGVTHMRAFVEVDAVVGMKCLEAGIALKQRAAREKKCHVQICAFAQLPLFSSSQGDEDGSIIRSLMRDAASREDVEALGSTPYVETDIDKEFENTDWMINLCMEFDKHLDFHLDYSMDPKRHSMVWHIFCGLDENGWNEKTTHKTVALGHCTLLTMFQDEDWQSLAIRIEAEGLPISFVGLPTSDLFMMRTGKRPEVRGTFDVPKYIKDWFLNACIGVNNIGNAFTPQGTCDPLSLACQGVGLYQAGTKRDAELLYECVSVRARAAIGFGSLDNRDVQLSIQPGDSANFVLLAANPDHPWRTRRSVSEAVYLYDHCQGRKSIWKGHLTS